MTEEDKRQWDVAIENLGASITVGALGELIADLERLQRLERLIVAYRLAETTGPEALRRVSTLLVNEGRDIVNMDSTGLCRLELDELLEPLEP